MSKHRQLTTGDYGAILRRRWLLILLPVLFGPAIGYGTSLLFRSRYTSHSLLLIEPQRVPDSYVKPVITEDLNQRVENIQQQSLSRTRLQPLVERYGLFKDQAAQKSMEELVGMLQLAIELTPIKPVVRSREEMVPGFQIDVTLEDPRVAQQVCSDVTSMFVDEDLRQREHTAQGTTNFLQSQLVDAKRNLDEQDAKLAAFKRKYTGMLPDQLQTTMNLLGPLQSQLEAVTQALNRAQQDKTYTESIIEQQVQAWEINTAMKSGVSPGQVTDPDPLVKRLSDLQNYLLSLKTHFTDDYPEVITVKSEIEDLQKQIRQAASRPKPKPTEKAEKSTEPEPPQIQQLRAQAHSYDDAIKSNSREQRRLTDQIKQYEARLQMSPVVEQQYKEITRDHQSALQFYNDLLSKRDQSGMATDLQRRQEGGQLRVMDPADLPAKPSFPNKPLFALGGLGLGLALGLGMALIAEQTDKRVRTEVDVEFYLGVSPFALIPVIETATNGKRALKGQEKARAGQKGPLSISGIH
jgi:polysaccharide chain length determinant protein (PEP-CTERM system associated)